MAIVGLKCPNCGAGIELRGFEHTQSVVCIQCLAVLDAKDPNLQVIQQFAERQRVQPLIPLGTRGKLHGDPYEVIGFQERTILVDGMPYSWHEYLLFNPFKGFRYLTQYNGHWNDVKTLRETPPPAGSKSGKPAVSHLGETYLHFQSAEASTTFVMGEFPWQVRVGEGARVVDYIAPPRMLSVETTGSEQTWSMGEYIEGARVWEAFQLRGSPPPAAGTFANQPSPYTGKPGTIWRAFLGLVFVLVALAWIFTLWSREEEVFRQRYTYAPGRPGEASFVTRTFDLGGRTSNVELSIRTDLSNNWAYFNFALINEQTGQALDFAREVSYYFGRDGDGAWNEGSKGDRVLIPSVPAGRYYLRVEPEMNPQTQARSMSYDLQLRRDVPAYSYFLIVALLLVVPPAAVSLRAAGFEKARWAESDHAPASADDSDSDSDDGDD